jgi:hypothetical protein
MVSASVEPLNICDRARCRPEKELLQWRWARELSKDYWIMEAYE